MPRLVRRTALVLCLLILPLWGRAAPTIVDFDSFLDGEQLSNQIAGLAFSNAMILTAGISLNEFEFPPRSGVNAAVDDGGALTIDFASPVLSVGGYFTYLAALTLEGFDVSLNSIGTTSSAFVSNLALSGDPGSAPNEFIGLDFAAGISRIVVTGDPGGFSLVVDDLTYTLAVPEPGTVPLLAAGVGILVLARSVAGRRRDRACRVGVDPRSL